MITKSDVVMWFRALESYKRIDTMCTLLNMCLPFELRFLGTCLEELGRRDSQDLRGMELRANNPQDLATDMIACQNGEPTDMKVRRMMALYLALIRSCNRTNVTQIFRTLESWGELDFSNMTDVDTLKELLLVYTMAAHHPVFDFDQHLKCFEIFDKIKENKLAADPPSSPSPSHPTQQSHASHQHLGLLDQPLSMAHQQLHQHPVPPQPSQQELMQHAALQHHQLLAPTPLHMLPQGTIPMNFPQSHLAKITSPDGSALQHQIATVDGIPHMISSNIIPDTNNAAAILTHPNAASWALRQFHPQQQPPPQQQQQTAGNQALVDHPPQTSSPLLSQQSTPSSSRATSPNRTSSCDSTGGLIQSQQQQNQTQQVRNMSQRLANSSMKNIRRPSAETTPPPPTLSQLGNDLIMSGNMKHIQEVGMNNEGSGGQLQTLIRNGYTRSANRPRMKANINMSSHQQQQQSPVNQQHYQQGNYAVTTYAMQAMNLNSDLSSSGHHSMDGIISMNSNKSTGSDSGSSIGSPGERSPPETPTLMMNNTAPNPAMRGGVMDVQQKPHQHQQPTQKLHQPSQLSYNKQMSLQRMNGRSEKISGGGGGGGAGNNVINASAIIYAQPQQQQTQSQQALYAEMVLGPGGNAIGGNVMQTSLTSSNTANNSVAANVVSSNNNMVGSNSVLISSPSALTSNSVILQSHPQPYNASYPYHAQHLATTARPPQLMAHNPGMAPPPHSNFRFQLPPPNSAELLYPAFHPQGSIAFLPGGAPAVALRTTSSGATVVTTQVVSQPTGPQQQVPPTQQQPQLQQATQVTPVLPSPYSSLPVGLTNKPISCYNCGSQSHSGRECQEASMDDVTRSAIYKLDYSQAATGAGAGTTSATASTPANPQQQLQQQQQQHQQQHHQQQQSVTNSASESTTSLSSKSHDSSAVNSMASSVTSSASSGSANVPLVVTATVAGGK